MIPGASPFNTMKKTLLKGGVEARMKMWHGQGSPVAAFLPNGRKVYLYPRKYMAEAVGLKRGTLRLLEGKGAFPATCFRDEFGCMAYSLEQIRAAVILYDSHAKSPKARKGRGGNGSPVSSPAFIGELQSAFSELEKLYKGEGSDEEVIEILGINPFPRFSGFPERRGVHDKRGG
jgi:hypothetical protein